jgi:RES domain
VADRAHRSLSNISIFELRRRIASLRTADLKHLTDEAAAYRIGHVIDQYQFQLRTLQLTGIYRARSNKPGEVFTSASQLWYPPADAIPRPSRLNGITQVRFYASSMPNTATLELRPQADGVFTILVARTRSGKMETLQVAFIGLERSLAPEVQHFTERDLFRSNPDFRKALGPANYKKWLLIDDYLSEAFGTAVPEGEEYRYKPTIALANLLFSAPGMDAINYPSVASGDHGINVCILPDKADQLFVPKEAWMVRIGKRVAHPQTGEPLPLEI